MHVALTVLTSDKKRKDRHAMNLKDELPSNQITCRVSTIFLMNDSDEWLYELHEKKGPPELICSLVHDE